MRILLAGDWHGNVEFSARVLERAGELGCRAVLQLGDFGLWPGRENEWLDHIDVGAAEAGVEVVWVDGNHEHHALLERLPRVAGGLVPMRRHVTWASRGARWEWAGLRFGALGGAVSVDRMFRRPGRNWWPGEIAAEEDVERLGYEPLDVLATHAAPSAYPPPERMPRLPAGVLADVAAHRGLLDRAVANTGPRLVVHGHYHQRLHADLHGWSIDGLAHDKAELDQACGLLDLDEDLQVRTPKAPGSRP
jgi:hypothetical protein